VVNSKQATKPGRPTAGRRISLAMRRGAELPTLPDYPELPRAAPPEDDPLVLPEKLHRKT